MAGQTCFFDVGILVDDGFARVDENDPGGPAKRSDPDRFASMWYVMIVMLKEIVNIFQQTYITI